MNISKEEREQLRQVERQATPVDRAGWTAFPDADGVWMVNYNMRDDDGRILPGSGIATLFRSVSDASQAEDAMIFAVARNALPELLDDLDAADERISELQAENQRLHTLYYGEREAHNSRGGA